MKSRLLCFALAAAVFSLGAAAQAQPMSAQPGLEYLEKGAQVFLQYNLHPDQKRGRLYSMNYQLPALLTRCTPVTITDFNKKQVKFRTDSGKEYQWIFDKHIVADKFVQFGQFFASKCDDISGLSEIDQKGIASGVAMIGMSKKGVLYAMGLPPDHATPNPDAMDLWTYWRNKMIKTTVLFKDGLVVDVK